MENNFFDFLNKMESNSQYKEKDFKENNYEEENYDEPTEDHEEFRDIEQENTEQEDIEQEEESEMNDDDIIEKSLDYAKSVLKVVKENFNKKDQKIVFETLRNTLNMYLGENQQYSIETQVESIQSQKNPSPMLKGSTMTEEEWNKLDTNNLDTMNMYNQPQIPVEQLTPKASGQINESRSRAYTKELPLAVKINANGKPEVDLSKISSRDVDDMKVLMGLK